LRKATRQASEEKSDSRFASWSIIVDVACGMVGRARRMTVLSLAAQQTIPPGRHQAFPALFR
jgi:hypothetical protein